jgi:hypothetical protein
MEIHSRKMKVSKKVNFEELARSTDEFNAAQLKVRSSPSSFSPIFRLFPPFSSLPLHSFLPPPSSNSPRRHKQHC